VFYGVRVLQNETLTKCDLLITIYISTDICIKNRQREGSYVNVVRFVLNIQRKQSVYSGFCVFFIQNP